MIRRLFNVLTGVLLVLASMLVAIATRSHFKKDAFVYQDRNPALRQLTTSGICWNRGRLGFGRHVITDSPGTGQPPAHSSWLHDTGFAFFGTDGNWRFWYSHQFSGWAKLGHWYAGWDFAVRIWPLVAVFVVLPLAWIVMCFRNKKPCGRPVVQGTSESGKISN